jgi:hypothetical protein
MNATGRQLVTLLGPTLRAIRWEVSATAGALTVLLLTWKHEQLQSPGSGLALVRAAALLLILGALPLLDDPAARQVAALPVPLAVRCAIRLAGFAVLVFAPVAALAASSNLPIGALMVETTAIVALACSASIVLTRATDHSEPSSIVSVALLPLPAVLGMLPAAVALVVPQGPQWTGAHQRWSILAAVGLAALAFALRDPASKVVVARVPIALRARRSGRVVGDR